MIVGELVEEEWQEYVAQNDMVLLSGAVPSMNALAILHDLGIWDAEVLEGQIIKGYTEDGDDRFGIAPLDGKLPYVWVAAQGDVVRLIVLKEDE